MLQILTFDLNMGLRIIRTYNLFGFSFFSMLRLQVIHYDLFLTHLILNMLQIFEHVNLIFVDFIQFDLIKYHIIIDNCDTHIFLLHLL
jgi:hypothetical protein